MTLEQAIEHAREKARGNGCCAEEHKQLAEWLMELKRFRESKDVKPLPDGWVLQTPK